MKPQLFTPLRLSVALMYAFSSVAYAQATFTEDAEYYASGALPLSNAAEAYRLGFTGKGVSIGINDQPINVDSPEFSTKDKSITRQMNFPIVDGREWRGDTVDAYQGKSDWDRFNHGTHVAGLAAASRNGVGMQGIAPDAQLVGSSAEELRGSSLKGGYNLGLFKDQTIKVVNLSWGDIFDWDNYFAYISTETLLNDQKVKSFLDLLSYDKLFIVASGNASWTQATMNSSLGWISLAADNTQENYDLLYNNIIDVSALNNIALRYDENTGTVKIRDGIKGSPIITFFSNGTKYSEDMGIAAAGHYLMSANAAFKSPGAAIDIPESGTSMAAPVVTGAGALVQQAFPYLTSKQIGDVLLSTASLIETKQGEESYMASLGRKSRYVDKLYSEKNGRKVTAPMYDLSVYYFDSKEHVGDKTREELIQAAAEQLHSIAEVASKEEANPEQQGKAEKSAGDFLASIPGNVHVRAYYNTPLDVLVGAGAVNAGSAVRGLGALNARRMTPDDKLTVANFNTQFMDTTPYSAVVQPRDQMIYAVDTQGYNSTWSNDIKEVREGRIAADSTQADLARRYEFYRENWIDRQPENGWKEGSKYAGKSLIDFGREYTAGLSEQSEDENEVWGGLFFELQNNINLTPEDAQFATKEDMIAEMTKFVDPSRDYTPPQRALSAMKAYSLSIAYTDITEAAQTREMLGMYNDFVQEHQLENLPVGLHKQGAGILTLAGKNTYQGDTIVSGGGLNITGSVLGDVYSLNHGANQFTPENIGSAAFGTVMGTGTIGGTLVNSSLAIAGNTEGTGVLTMRNLVSTPSSVLQVSVANDGKNHGQFLVTASEALNPLVSAVARTPEAGMAYVDNARIRVMNAIPDYVYTVIKADKVHGKVSYDDQSQFAFMDGRVTQDTSTVKAIFTQANHLVGASAEEQDIIGKVHAMYKSLPVDRNNNGAYSKADLQAFYQLNPEQGLQVAQDLVNPAVTQMSTLAQTSTLAAKNIRQRHSTWQLGMLSSSRAVTQLEPDSVEGDNAQDANAGTILRTQLDRAYQDNGLSAWVNIGASIGHLDDSFSGNQSSLSLGIDKGVGTHWRIGAFGSYTHSK